MKTFFRLSTALLSVFLLLASCAQSDPWLLGFEKTRLNPILTAEPSYSFICPVSKDTVAWQQADVFNPGAIVRNDTVFLLFRAEDNPDAIIGGRTSRIGLAYSIDGIHFTKYPDPVLFPDNDEFQQWDYPGGVEDPRIVELPDGGYVMLYTSWNTKLARLSSAYSQGPEKLEKVRPGLPRSPRRAI